MLDFIVVALSYVQLGDFGNYTAIRAVRILRPLRTVTRIQGMKVLVETMLTAIPQLLDVLVLCAFIYLVFGIIAVQLWAGALQYRCGARPVGTGSHVGVLEDTFGVLSLPTFGSASFALTMD